VVDPDYDTGVMKKKIHYAGRVSFRTAKGALIKIEPGMAACCTGERAKRIALEGMHTYSVANVTCQHCLKMVNRHRDYEQGKKVSEEKKQKTGFGRVDLELFSRQNLFGRSPAPKDWTVN
jgi:hypothetical protein